MTTKKSQLPVVRVTWIDAEEVGDIGWNCLKHQKRKAKEPCPTIISVGHVLFQSDKHISLVSTIGPDISGAVEKIPSQFIVSIEELVPNAEV